MTEDIGPILKNWKYVVNDINVRMIDGVDGQPKVQMRLDLGMLQMELDGRPDGMRPNQSDTYLSFFQQEQQTAELRGEGNVFKLSPMDCLKLQQESIQYYHRYLALMKLKDYTRVVRDTEHNLEVFDFVNHYAEDEEIKWSFEQYRSYVLMMSTRARAAISLDNHNYDEALALIEQGVERINAFYDQNEKSEKERGVELEFLKQWADDIRKQRPVSPEEKLKKELKKAIENEEYERAAQIRDEIKVLHGEYPNREQRM